MSRTRRFPIAGDLGPAAVVWQGNPQRIRIPELTGAMLPRLDAASSAWPTLAVTSRRRGPRTQAATSDHDTALRLFEHLSDHIDADYARTLKCRHSVTNERRMPFLEASVFGPIVDREAAAVGLPL